MAGGPFAANLRCSCRGVGDRFFEAVEDDPYLCRGCGKTFFIICWEREEELPTQLFHPEIRVIQPSPPPPRSGPTVEP